MSIVGPRNAAELAGLHWFLTAVWPLIRTASPRAALRLGGGLAGVRTPLPPGVSRGEAGADPLADAGVVVFPRRIDPGDPFAVLEVLRRGKAVVASPAARFSLPTAVQDALCVADTAAAMAERITELLASPIRRAELAGRGLAGLGVSAGGGGEDPLAEILRSVRPSACEAAGARRTGSDANLSGVPAGKGL